ncbi:hypothetical protein Mal65_16830 [Crateriforma conspicua]|nr:hypothetical protein Mal65_16830 [Crateriforma conspicua]
MARKAYSAVLEITSKTRLKLWIGKTSWNPTQYYASECILYAVIAFDANVVRRKPAVLHQGKVRQRPTTQEGSIQDPKSRMQWVRLLRHPTIR